MGFTENDEEILRVRGEEATCPLIEEELLECRQIRLNNTRSIKIIMENQASPWLGHFEEEERFREYFKV